MSIQETKKKYFAHESCYIDEPCEIGEDTRIWHFSHVMKNTKIGDGCRIGQNVVISPSCTIGNKVKIQNNVSIYTGVELEDFVFCGPSMVFTNVNNPRSEYPQETEDVYLKTVVGRGASIGANATVVCGHNIGHHAFIGAGSVVTKDVKPYALMYGNPARQQGWMSEAGAKLEFVDGKATCSKTGHEYVLRDESVERVK